MKKIFLLNVLTLGFSILSLAQFFETDTIFRNKLVTSTGDQQFGLSIKLMGDYKNSNDHYTWRREVINLEGDWETAVCDPWICWQVTTNTESFTSDSTKDESVIVYFYMPDSSAGKGGVRLILKNNRTQIEDTSVFLINVWNRRLGVEKFKRETVTVYPNPSVDYINLRLDAISVSSITIYDLNGRMVKSFLEPKNGMDIRFLKKGIYLIRVNSLAGYQFLRFEKI